MIHKQINLMHIFLIGPTLYQIGNKGLKNEDASNYYKFLGCLIVIMPFIISLSIKNKLNYRNIIIMLHFLIILPFLTYVYYKGENMEHKKTLFRIIKYLGIIIMLVHIYLLYEKIFNPKKKNVNEYYRRQSQVILPQTYMQQRQQLIPQSNKVYPQRRNIYNKPKPPVYKPKVYKHKPKVTNSSKHIKSIHIKK